MRTHPLQARYNLKHRTFCDKHFLHAEVHALVRSGRADLSGADIYVYREAVDGSLLQSKPCASCYQACVDAGISCAIFT